MSTSPSQASAAYRRAATAVSPLVAIVRLLDQAVLRVSQASGALDERRYDAAFTHVERAAAILRGLQHGLDHDGGGQLATRLDAVYTANIVALHRAIGKADGQRRLGDLAEGLKHLRDAWASIASSSSGARSGRASEEPRHPRSPA